MKLLNIKNIPTICLGLVIVTIQLAGCNTGIDRSSTSSSSSSNSNTLDDGEPADPSYVKLREIEHKAESPSVVSILFQATDEDDRNIDSLSITDFQITEDEQLLPAKESASFIVRPELMPVTFDTVVMLDISSSITKTDLDNMKQAVNELVRDPSTGVSRLFPGQRVAIYSFNDGISKIKGFSTSPAHIVKALNDITLPNSITPTDLFGAVISGTALWEVNQSIAQVREGVVILITDGTDTAGRHTISSTLDAIDEKKVITIGVGEAVNEEVLTDLGVTNSFTVENFSDLNGVLATVRDQLSRYIRSYYILKYASPKRAAEGKVSNSDHDFTLEVIDNDNSKSNASIDGEFNSHSFRNVSPRVVIGGTNHLEPGQSATYLAQTHWPIRTPSYNWAFSGDCSLDRIRNETITVSATNAGNCQISVTDDANNNVLSNISVSVSGE